MLVKVKLGDAQKFVKITELSLEEFCLLVKIYFHYIILESFMIFFLIYVLLDGCLVILYENILYSCMCLDVQSSSSLCKTL